MIHAKIENGEKKYTLKNSDSVVAVPAKYSVGDQYSKERIIMKKRFKIFPFDE